ncbi:MAG TPA: hypothetical protein DDW27_17470 [Bacteroidales bacterium]|nr:hypothetical protein [Bacteroidales bacterium]
MYKAFLTVTFTFNFLFLSGQITFENDLLVMENEVCRHSLSFARGRIIPVSVFSKGTNNEILASDTGSPWFEFVINRKKITSSDPLWRVRNHEIRRLNNGGSEVKIIVGATAGISGLELEIYRQIFPNSTLIREKIILKNSSRKKLALNKLNGNIHFIFPRYNINSSSLTDNLTETRIATFDKELISDFNPDLTWDDRTRSLNLSHCHMFHPEILSQVVTSGDDFMLKGPFAVYSTQKFSWLMTYEHASQDKNYGSEFGNAIKRNLTAQGIDLQQGVEGASGIVEGEDEFWFLAVAGSKKETYAFNSTLPDLHHGSKAYSKEEIRDRYGYMLPFYVTRAMKELREYNPDVVIEIDLTEKERCIIGLMPLQEGKLFWMNNGASAYNDYSTIRTKSMRTVINEYAGIIPTELFTQAVYPHQIRPYDAQRYNVNTTLIGGRGFWGNLKMMTSAQRKTAGELVLKSKMVLPYIADLPLQFKGKTGASPEIYKHINEKSCAGQVIAFSGSALNYPYTLTANTDSCLAVLNHAYSVDNEKINLPFQFTKPDDTREAFIIPNKGTGISIISSTGWLDKAELNSVENKLFIKTGTGTEMIIRLHDNYKDVTSGGIKLKEVSYPLPVGYKCYVLKTEKAEEMVISWNKYQNVKK